VLLDDWRKRERYLLKPALFLACLVPLLLLILDGMAGELDAEPVKQITHRTGDWILRFLLVTLAITPVSRMTGKPGLLRFRRMLGLYTFFYAVLHFVTYIWLDQQFAWSEIIIDVTERPYITVGFSAFLLLIPLAVTSTNGMMKRLGRRWKRLHRLVYLIGVLGVLHYLWLVKADILLPVIHIVILVILLGYRVWYARQKTLQAAVSRL
jgi:sulfoxide reductase heme-binding subunit YedZ